MTTKLISLTHRAKEDKNCKFTSLAHLLDENFLTECYWELKRMKAPGIDGITVEKYGNNLSDKIKDLVEKLKTKRYRVQPVKRAYIPKEDGSKRPLGIPTVEDKIVQMGIKKILEAIYEVDFLDVSYGFRPNRSCHKALDELDRAIMKEPVNYVVDMDIEKFFDTVDHKLMMECLRQRIVDPSFLRLIGKFLKAGVMEEGKYIEIEEGTPQGGVLSPILANIYLHYLLDKWVEGNIRKQSKGYVKMIRYADDFIVCFQIEEEAKEFGNKLKERLSKGKLKIAEKKSKIIEFGQGSWYKARKEKRELETFDFLGFTHYCCKSRKGKFRLGRKTISKRYSRKLKEINKWVKEIRNEMQLNEWWKILGKKLEGYYRYYGIGGNSEMLNNFHDCVKRIVYKWINRRSQKKSYTWEGFKDFVKYKPLPKPKIYRPYPAFAK